MIKEHSSRTSVAIGEKLPDNTLIHMSIRAGGAVRVSAVDDIVLVTEVLLRKPGCLTTGRLIFIEIIDVHCRLDVVFQCVAAAGSKNIASVDAGKKGVSLLHDSRNT